MNNGSKSKEINGSRACYLYINAATYKSLPISKIGYSYTPEKRNKEHNNGLRYRYYGNHIDQPVVFVRFFTIHTSSIQESKNIEKMFFAKFKDKVISGFGREVIALEPESAAKELICCLVNYHD